MLERDSLADKAVKLLVSRIFRGQYPAGHRLPSERKLSQDLNVSRGTLRSCIATLNEMGLLESRPGSGTYVRDPDTATVPGPDQNEEAVHVSLEDIISGREAIEGAAFRLAQERHSADDLEALKELLESMKDTSENLAHFMSYDMAFHRQLVAASGNRVLLVAFDAISEFHRFSQAYTSYKENEIDSTIEQHERIISAVESGDPTRSDALVEHFRVMGRYSVEESGR